MMCGRRMVEVEKGCKKETKVINKQNLQPVCQMHVTPNLDRCTHKSRGFNNNNNEETFAVKPALQSRQSLSNQARSHGGRNDNGKR
jgi:hypothetical protein